jgi:hypothetical protein
MTKHNMIFPLRARSTQIRIETFTTDKFSHIVNNILLFYEKTLINLKNDQS